MAYCTAQDLRERYETRGVDEFAGRTGAELNGYLEQAAETIDRYRPDGVLGVAATKALRNCNFILGRAMAHDEMQLESEHPVMRDYAEAMAWLRDLASGKVALPKDDDETDASSKSSVVVSAPAEVFTEALLDRMPGWPV